MSLTRRNLFKALAGLPVVGKLAKPESVRLRWRRPGEYAARGRIKHAFVVRSDGAWLMHGDRPENIWWERLTPAEESHDPT